MKSISFLFCLFLCLLPGSFELSAACNTFRTYSPKSFRRTQKNTTSSSVSSSSKRRYKSLTTRKIEALRKKERGLLSDVQHLQSVLCLRRDKLSPRQKEKYEKQLLKKLDALQNSTGKLQDFPFQEKMNAFNELVADIQTGKISWESCKGKKELYIIRKLHQAQLSSLLRSYNYREID